MMAVGRSVLERAKKTLVYFLPRLRTSGIDIIEEGGVGGSMAQHHSFTRAFFLHTPESILFFTRIYSEIWTAKLLVGRWHHLVRRYARAFDIPPLLIGMPLLRSLVSVLFVFGFLLPGLRSPGFLPPGLRPLGLLPLGLQPPSGR